MLYLQVEEVKTWFEERLKPSKVINIGKVLYDFNQFLCPMIILLVFTRYRVCVCVCVSIYTILFPQ